MKITEYQALNILAAKYKDNAAQRERFNNIKALLLSTEKSPEDQIIKAELFRDVALTQYEIIPDHSTSLFTPKQMQQIEHALDTQIKANKSGANIVLTVGESLLMVINACKKTTVDMAIMAKLKALYLDGVKSADDKKFITTIKNYLADTKQYTVSTDPKVLNADHTRRYFETHLSYHLLKSKSEGLDIEQLRTFNKNLKINLWNVLADKTKEKTEIDYILNGVMHPSLNKYQLEYAELIGKLKDHNYHGLSAKACDNLCEIAKSTMLATLNTQHDKFMPADIYEHSIFTMGMDGRGRIIKKPHDDVRTGAKGIMRSTSPLPVGDLVRDGDTEEYEVPLFEDQLDEFEQHRITPQITIESLELGRTIKLVVSLPEEQKRQIIDIARRFNLIKKIPHPLHITLAYRYKNFDTKIETDLKNELNNALGQLLSIYQRTFLLNPPQLCFFHDMKAFIPWDCYHFPF